MTILRDDFEVRNGFGAIFLTTPDRDIAVAYVKAKSSTFPGLVIDQVTVTEVRRRAYRPRLALVSEAA